MLEHEVRVTVNMPLTYCLKCILDPSEFLGKSRYTYAVRRLGEDKYEVVFRWVKWGMERFYKVVLEARRYDNRILYMSTPESQYEFSMEFDLEEVEDGNTRVRVVARMKAGLMANLIGKGDYKGFVEELVEKGILEMARSFARKLELENTTSGMEAGCLACILYDPDRKYCYALGKTVGDPQKPECKGRFYISREKMMEALG